MADIKTTPTSVSPAAFIGSIESAQRRKDCRELVALMRLVTGHPPKMWGPSIVGFDRYHYRYDSGREGDMLLTGFFPRKQHLVLYVGPGLKKDLLAKLGRHKTGKSCLYLNGLADVDRAVLRAIVEASVDAMRKLYPRE